ncbi:MAG: Vms1/Ankzf1 family peptidyl-tRNA hydrolase, partial [Trebonia sp.]
AHARAPRAVGVLLVRLGGYSAGVFTGYPPVLADAKTGSRLVHGRSAAGGWSQQRFARRREKQASEALEAAAGAALAVFGRWEAEITASSASAPDRPGGAPGRGRVTRPRSGGARGEAASRGRRLDVVVLGGDKRAVAGLRGDPRLAPYLALATERFLTVPDPKRAVLEGTPRLFTAVRIKLLPPGGTTRTPAGLRARWQRPPLYRARNPAMPPQGATPRTPRCPRGRAEAVISLLRPVTGIRHVPR